MVPFPRAPVWCQDVRCGCWHVGSGMHLGRVAPSGIHTSLQRDIHTLSTIRNALIFGSINVSACVLCCRYHSLLETQIWTSWPRSLRLLGHPQKKHGLSVSDFLSCDIYLCFYWVKCEDDCIHSFVEYLCREWVVYQTMFPSKYFPAHLWNTYLVQLETTY